MNSDAYLWKKIKSSFVNWVWVLIFFKRCSIGWSLFCLLAEFLDSSFSSLINLVNYEFNFFILHLPPISSQHLACVYSDFFFLCPLSNHLFSPPNVALCLASVFSWITPHAGFLDFCFELSFWTLLIELCCQPNKKKVPYYLPLHIADW